MTKDEFASNPAFHTKEATQLWREAFVGALRGMLEWDAAINERHANHEAGPIIKGCANLADEALVEARARGRL